MKKITKILSVLMAAVMALTALGITAFADSIEDTAKSIKSGTKYSTTLYNHEDKADYKIKVTKSGNLKINLNSSMWQTHIKVYDVNGNYVEAEKVSSTSGDQFGNLKNFTSLLWNDTLEKYSGTITYKVKKGTYYIRFEREWGSEGSGELNFTATFPSSSSSKTAKISYLSIEIPKGTTMQLGAVLSAKSDTKVTWSTSKSSVVSVTSKGKITAKKKGSAIITAKLGSSTMKIKIKVT